MQHSLRRRFDLGAGIYADTGAYHLVGRDMGRCCRDAIEQEFGVIPAGAVITLDCSRIDHLDFSAADECFVKLTRRVVALEYGDIYLVLAGTNQTHEENLVVALERVHLAVLVQRKTGTEVLGHINPYLAEVFQYIVAQRAITARDWADDSGELISLASTKLLDLYNLRLVQRQSERLPDGGRQFIYQPVEGQLPSTQEPPTPAQRKQTKG